MQTNSYLDYKEIIADTVGKVLAETGLEKQAIYALLEYPPDEKLGDLALPCFQLSKILKKAPNLIAQELEAKIDPAPYFEAVKATGPYLNFFVAPVTLAGEVLGKIMTCGSNYGAHAIGGGQNIVIDFSAPNIAKPFHVGHLSSTVIGNALYKIFEFLGYNCVGINHLGDWGTQFGKLITAYKKWGSAEAVEKGLIKELQRLYVKFHSEAEQDPSLEDEAREWFRKIENGDEEALSLWRWFKDISLEEFQRVYDLLEISFDSMAGESFYNDKIDAVLDELKEKQLLVESDGAAIVNLEDYGMPPCLILKKDGSTLYATRDIAAALYRKKTYQFVKALYVTGAAQSLHFKQWFKVVELMGYDWAKDLVHIPFGLVSLEGEKLSTRKGRVVLLEDLLRTAIEKTLAIINEKNPGLARKEEVAQMVGVGAVVFGALSVNRIKDVTFSWEEALSFEGETGPYLQYTHARACSILRKAGFSPEVDTFAPEKLNDPAALRVVKTLYLFPEKVLSAANEYEPSIISRYLIDLAHAFNGFYHECQVLVDDPDLQRARLVLVWAVKTVLATGLGLLGIKAPEQM
ncbi:MAG TPA: arginine--tRNA ligase [Firmicutes bacterium]|uniref:Arginine--tRNA ligase n=1 Tax=Capillibacterium thermochitinicola TaxID=2699427 RepID=A0A8J6LJG5_9FIRM|nr:arginine--tRNA ligase [Capillibacterium thermochitinicola]MBA2133831.1 arginine--tRNA ligase [Capillibacterium thermochitinicola]HHW11626.1 arginine--tRNA ligase [Bacillota bacterium]